MTDKLVVQHGIIIYTYIGTPLGGGGGEVMPMAASAVPAPATFAPTTPVLG